MTIPKIAPALVVAGLAIAITASPAHAEDNGGQPQPSCPNIFGSPVQSGGVIVLPPGELLTPSGSTALPQAPPTPITPPMPRIYVCQGGQWVEVGREVGLQVASDTDSVEVAEGSAANLGGTYQSESSLVTFGTSAGTVAPDSGSTWSWFYRPDDGPASFSRSPSPRPTTTGSSPALSST